MEIFRKRWKIYASWGSILFPFQHFLSTNCLWPFKVSDEYPSILTKLSLVFNSLLVLAQVSESILFKSSLNCSCQIQGSSVWPFIEVISAPFSSPEPCLVSPSGFAHFIFCSDSLNLLLASPMKLLSIIVFNPRIWSPLYNFFFLVNIYFVHASFL